MILTISFQDLNRPTIKKIRTFKQQFIFLYCKKIKPLDFTFIEIQKIPL